MARVRSHKMRGNQGSRRGWSFLYRRRLVGFLARISFAASCESPRIMPELLRMASGHKAFAAFFRVVKSSELIFTLTWTVRFPVVSIPSIVTSVLFDGNDTVGIFRT